MKKLVFLICLVTIILTGCNINTRDLGISPYQKNGEQDRMFGSYETNRRSGEFTDFAISEQNQDLLGMNNNNKSDVEKAREVIRQIGLYEVGNIELKGNRMIVTAYSNDDLNAWTQREAEEDIRSNLSSTLPNYFIDVNVR